MILDMYEILFNRSLVKISGLDGAKFLQNLTTNDVIAHDNCYTYSLNNQGRYLFDFFVCKLSPEQFYLDVSSSLVTQLIEKLLIYKMRARVEFVDCSDEYFVLYSHNDLGCIANPSYQDPRYNKLGRRSIVPKHMLPIRSPVIGLYLADKYKFAIPDGDTDLVQGKSIPIEYGAEELNAVNYSKGCYIGQEVISRAKYQGVVRKKIYKISSEQALGDIFKTNEIIINDKKIGILCSYHNNKGIALIREEHYVNLQNANTICVNESKMNISIAEWYDATGQKCINTNDGLGVENDKRY